MPTDNVIRNAVSVDPFDTSMTPSATRSPPFATQRTPCARLVRGLTETEIASTRSESWKPQPRRSIAS
jgi:hypothetical protein